nr:PREDICTED: mannose-specific lectin-like [Musa acuminata subsp. malaccensis]
MQADGNLVIYSNGNALWASDTSRNRANYILVLQRDRNVVIYGPAIWATGTNYRTPGLVIARNATGTPVVVASAAEDVNNRKIAMVTKELTGGGDSAIISTL